MSCKDPDFSGVNFPRGVRRGGTEGVDKSIYAALDCPKDYAGPAWCINCGQPLNWLNAKFPFLCSLCQKRKREGMIILLARFGQGIVGIAGEGVFNDPDLGIVVKFFKNGGLKIKRL